MSDPGLPTHLLALFQLFQEYIGFAGRLHLESFFSGKKPKEAVKAIRELTPQIAAARREGLYAEYNSNGVLVRPARPGELEPPAIPEEGAVQNLLARASEGLVREQVQRQLNKENVVAEAAAAYEDIGAGSPDDDVDVDWMNRFFGIAAEMSSERAQKLWGNLLAGELASPGSYSLRSLDVLRGMSMYDAMDLEKSMSVMIDAMGDSSNPVGMSFMLHAESEGRGIGYRERQNLISLGLVAPEAGRFTSQMLHGGNNGVELRLSHYRYANRIYAIYVKNEDYVAIEPVYFFTRPAVELSGLVASLFDESYAKLFLHKWDPYTVMVYEFVIPDHYEHVNVNNLYELIKDDSWRVSLIIDRRK